jgi:hypothetical protein
MGLCKRDIHCQVQQTAMHFWNIWITADIALLHELINEGAVFTVPVSQTGGSSLVYVTIGFEEPQCNSRLTAMPSTFSRARLNKHESSSQLPHILSQVWAAQTASIRFYLCLWPSSGERRPPLWSSGQSSWLQIRRPGFDSRHYQKKVVGLERGPLSLVSTTEELLDRKVASAV